MLRVVVDSSSIVTIGYARVSGVLEVEFSNGGVYQYFGVPAREHARLMAAESKGKYLNCIIKPRFDAVRVDGARR